MNLEYKSFGSGMFLVYSVPEDDAVNPVGIFDVATERIPGFAPTKYSEEDRVIEYDVTGKSTLREFLSNQVSKRQLICVLDSMLDALITARDKKIDLRSLVLEEDFVFVDPVTAHIEFLCLPLTSRTAVADLNGFFKGIIMSLKYEQEEDSAYLAKLITYLNETKYFIYEEFKAFIRDISGRNNLEEEFFSQPEEDFIVEIVEEEVEEEKTEVKKPAGMFDTYERKTLTANDILNGD